MKDHISPDQAANAILTNLRLAEMYQQWSLFRSLLRYITDSGGQFVYLGPQQYLLQYPQI